MRNAITYPIPMWSTLVFLLASSLMTPAESRIVIQADQAEHEIAPEIYGHFAEHLGRCIYDGIWVGPESDIPNVNGIRKDVLEALKALNIPVLRWPGGCFADEYHWREGIGPPESRPRMLNTHWGRVVEDNSFGTHEFLELCELLDCEAYIAGNVGSGTVEEMQDWVEYMTFDGDSEMADLRRANGRDTPWRVRYFGVGNENWGCGGDMTAEHYANLYRRYATYVRDYSGNDIIKIACGPGGYNMEWMETMMRDVGFRMDAVSMHAYVFSGSTWADKGHAIEFNQDEWLTLMQKTLEVDGWIREFCELMDRYDGQKRVGLYVDEWGTWWNKTEGSRDGFLEQQNTLRDAVSAGIFLNIFNSHCERIRMGNIAQTVNVLQAMIHTQGEQMLLTPTYHVFEMYKVHQGGTLLPIELEAETLLSGDDTIPALSVSASQAEDQTIHVTICNLDPVLPRQLSMELPGSPATGAEGRALTGDQMQAHNTFDAPDNVRPEALETISVVNGEITVVVPPHSVSLVSLR